MKISTVAVAMSIALNVQSIMHIEGQKPLRYHRLSNDVLRLFEIARLLSGYAEVMCANESPGLTVRQEGTVEKLKTEAEAIVNSWNKNLLGNGQSDRIQIWMQYGDARYSNMKLYHPLFEGEEIKFQGNDTLYRVVCIN